MNTTGTTQPRTAPKIHSAQNTRAQPDVVTVYRGVFTLISPNPDDPTLPLAELVACGHGHDRQEDAVRCGVQLAVKTIRDRDRADRAAYRVPCVMTVWRSALGGDAGLGVFYKACSAHHQASPFGHGSLDGAAADDWSCRFAGQPEEDTAP